LNGAVTPKVDDLLARITALESVLANTTTNPFYDLTPIKRVSNINNVRTSFGWRQVTLESMGIPASLAGQVTRVKIAFFGFLNQPDSGSTSYVFTSEDGSSSNEDRVLTARSSGNGDSIALQNTVMVSVNAQGSFYVRCTTGFNFGLYADCQGYETNETIL